MAEFEEMLGDYDLTTFLFKCKQDFSFFCDNVLVNLFKTGGIQNYMKEWFEIIENNPKVYILAARGFAKTTILGVAYPIWLAYTKKNLNIMIVSRSEGQSKRVLEIIKSTIEGNPLLSEMKPQNARDTWSAKQINTTTNCKIFCKPFTKSILGERNDYILMDEADSYEYPELFFDYVVPTLNPGGKVALITTPDTGTTLGFLIKEKNLDYIQKSYPALDEDGESIWPERFTKENLEKIRKELGESLFQKNFMCNPLAESGQSVFTAESIRACSDRGIGFTTKSFGGEVFMGCDFAIASGPTADFDAYTIIERVGDEAILKYAEFHKGFPLPAKVNRIKELVEKYNVQMTICDQSHIGDVVIKELRFQGLSVEAQQFYPAERTKLLNNLKVVLDNYKLKIPRSIEDDQASRFGDRLEAELLSVVEKTNKSGRTTYSSTGAHDDTVMSLALALKHVNLRREFEDYWGISN